MTSMTLLRPSNLWASYSYKVATPDGTLYIFIDVDENKNPVRVHTNAGKSGNSLSAWAAGVSILINELLEKGVSLQEIIKILSGITADKNRTMPNGAKIFAGPHAIVHAFLQFTKDKHQGTLDD